MRIRRDLLFWGLLLTILGAVPLFQRAGLIDAGQLAGAWRLWPLLLVAVGLVLILGRGGASLVGTALLAIVIGLVGGGVLASGGDVFGELGTCGGIGRAGNEAPTPFDRDGTFDADASVSIELNCGSIHVVAMPGETWRVQADVRGNPPRVGSTGSSLDVESPNGFGSSVELMTVDLPADRVRDLSISANAGNGTLTLAGASLTTLDGELNAGDLRVDGTGATIERFEFELNAGRLRLILPAHATDGDLSANAGSIELCVPAEAGLRFDVEDHLTFSHNLRARGLSEDGHVWTRAGAAGAPVIVLTVDGSAASFNLDPDGGC